ncbi:hypothetical protein XU18_2735 [Perkinsela sp. CCAP 1560/4]|nr:hypothetical protein XU18_2735 [Perkinsela sp. CCAP 1560/4]|eukprot:KNH06230.1 hypothetical protein XU18_2735 [Perkinsela sp. CCAP 1560/4]
MESSRNIQKYDLKYHQYSGSSAETNSIQALIAGDLSEPYSIFTYRYFLSQWPNLCVLCSLGEDKNKESSQSDEPSKCQDIVACVVSKIEKKSEEAPLRGYIAMLTVDKNYRHHGIGTELVRQTIEKMRDLGCSWVYLETPFENLGALKLYENLGFIKEKRLIRYYMNGEDAFRLKLMLSS